MAEDDECVLPVVSFSVDTSGLEQMKQVAQSMASNGFDEAVGIANATEQKAQALSKAFIKNAGAKEVNQAQVIESQLVGHGKSGYVPTGNLQGSIKPEFSQDGMSVSIKPEATNKANDYYGQYVEFGTYKMAPEPYMKPSGEKVSADLDDEFETIVRKAVD